MSLPPSAVEPCPSPSLVYRIDEANRIVWVNDTWSDFARANGGELLLPAQILGQDLLKSFSDPTVRALYTAMIQRVRAGRPVHFDYRCDAPDQRRTFTMEIRLGPEGTVEFASTLQHEESREPVAVLSAGQLRDHERFIRVCSWCQGVALPSGVWVSVEEAVRELNLMALDRSPRLTHTICGPCHERMFQTLVEE